MDEELIELTTEENIELALEEIVEGEVAAEDLSQDIEAYISAEAAEVVPTEEIEIEIDESVGWVGGDSTRHYSLSGRDEPDQHTIKSITGLRDELDDIKSLKTICSDKIGFANYYEWNDGSYDDFGYFVSLVPHTSTIKICEGADIFGVTVNNAGFVGDQNADAPKDNKYALVVTTGTVDVRCETSIQEGDNVVSNSRGFAEKTESGCGYKVIAVNNKNGVNYASISLGVQACMTDLMGKKLKNLKTRMDDAEINIKAAIDTANEAYSKASECIISNGNISDKVDDALIVIDGVVSNVEIIGSQVLESEFISAQAKAIANNAVTSAESIRKEAYETANSALSDVNDLIKDLEPITQWEDPASGNTGAEYFARYIENGVATKIEVQTVNRTAEDNKSWIKHSGESIEMAVSSVDKYSVGEHSQAYGLTLQQAKSILKSGMIYIPTVKHKEDTFANGESDFLRYAYYEWNGESWVEFTNAVSFDTYVPAGDSLKYWYIEYDNAPEGYKPYVLYLVKDGKWTEVATLAGNVNNRITSMIRQDVDEVRAEVVNACGSVSGFGAWLSDTASEVQSMASWARDESGRRYNLATIKQTADSAGASIAQVVSAVGENGQVTAASIVTAVNDAGSSVVLDANHICLNGAVTANNNVTIGTDGKITAINANITGTITAPDGQIGGFSIKTDRITKGIDTASNDDTYISDRIYDGDILIASSAKKYGGTIANSESMQWWNLIIGPNFGVTNTGKLYASGAKISGEITADEGTIGGFKITSGATGLSSDYIKLAYDNIEFYPTSGTTLSIGTSNAIQTTTGTTKWGLSINGALRIGGTLQLIDENDVFVGTSRAIDYNGKVDGKTLVFKNGLLVSVT